MDNRSYIPEKYKILSGSALKMIALFTMILDHTASVLLSQYAFATAPLIQFGSHGWSLFRICRIIGRCAFPLYCFLLIEGFLHTRNRKKYGINLFLFAVLSEIPWNFEHTGKLTYSIQNVFFTLFLGFLAISCYELFRDSAKKQFLSLLLVIGLTLIVHADHGMSGVALIMIFYALRERPVFRAAIGVCLFGSPYYYLPPYLLMELYNGKRGFIRGPVLKYAFYVAYPAHLLILGYLKYVLKI